MQTVLFLNQKNWERAFEFATNCLQLDPSLLWSATYQVRVLLETDDLKGAQEVINKYQGASGINKFYLLEMKAALAATQGNIDEYLKIMAYLKTAAEDKEYSFGRIAELYFFANLFDEAAEMIEKAYDNRDQFLTENPGFIFLPEEMPNNPALQEAINKPELNALFEVRRRHLKLK